MIGENRIEEVKQQKNRFLFFACFFGVLSSLSVVVFTPLLGSYYSFTEETYAIAREISYAAAITVFCVSIQKIIAEGVLRAGGKTRIQMYVDAAGSWIIGLPVAYLAAIILKARAFWVYLSIRIPYIIKAVWSVYYLNRKDWIIQIQSEVRNEEN